MSSSRLVAWHPIAGGFEQAWEFPTGEEGLATFSEYLAAEGRDPVLVLVDIVEEEFREDTVPHVFGADRRSMLRTKLTRMFRDATYSTATFQGRMTDGRRDDRMLMTALIRPDLLSPWMTRIAEHKIPMAGVYSVPIVSQSLVKLLPIESAHALVVTLQAAGGVRQTFFHNGHLKLSRLAVMPTIDRRAQPAFVLGEVEKIRRYLNSLRMLPQDNPLDVYLIADRALLDTVRRRAPDSITTRHHLLELGSVAAKARLRGEYPGSFSDLLFVHLLARRPPAQQYAPASQTKYFTLHRARNGIRAAALLVLVAGLGWAGLKAFEGVRAARDAAWARQQTAFYEERYRIAREGLPEAPADPHDIKAAVETAGILAEVKVDPLPMMVALSEGLTGFPRLKLDRLEWGASADPDDEIGRAALSRPAPRAATPAPRGRRVVTAEAPEVLYQIALVRGQVAPFDGDYRAALEMVSRFAEALRAVPRVHDVQVVSLPLDIGSDNRLAGDASVDSRVGAAPFELRVVLKDRERAAG